MSKPNYQQYLKLLGIGGAGLVIGVVLALILFSSLDEGGTQEEIEKLKSDFLRLECNYAERNCYRVLGLTYYISKNLDIGCCYKIKGEFYCNGELTDPKEVKVIPCNLN